MTDTTEHVNGTAPAPALDLPGDCAECATGGEKVLAVLAAALGVFVIVMAIDMFTGGRITGMVRERAE
jgi:hypothetical protein